MAEKLWGKSQIADAKVLVPSFVGENKRLPMHGIQLDLRREHIIEILRCKNDIEYFAENYYEIFAGSKRELMQLWDVQKDALKHFQENKRVVMSASRQTSKSTLVRLYILWRMLFSEGTENIGMLANKFGTAKMSLKELKQAYEALPLFLKPPVKTYNEQSFILANPDGTDGTSIVIEATSPDALRGRALTALVIDEAAFINRNGRIGLDEDIWQSLGPTLEGVDLMGDGVESFCIFVSTPYGFNNLFAKLFHKAKEYKKNIDSGKTDDDLESEEITDWTHFELMWSDHPDRDQEWYQKKLREIGKVRFAVEFGGSFELGADLPCIIDPESEDMLESYLLDPITTGSFDLTKWDQKLDKSFKIWERPIKGHIYHAGVDVAEGVGGCYSAINVFDFTDLSDIRQVAEYKSNIILPSDFASICVNIFNNYNQCYASVERNNIGKLLLHLITAVHGYTRLVIRNAGEETTNKDIQNKVYGINSHNNTKVSAVATLKYYLNHDEQAGKVKIRSKELLTELQTFVKLESNNSNTKWGKSSKDVFDDLVDSMMWCFYTLHVHNVKRYYKLGFGGFNKSGYPIDILEPLIKVAGSASNTLHINNNGGTMVIYTDANGFSGDFNNHYSNYDPDLAMLQEM